MGHHITIQRGERPAATKSNAAGTQRDGDIGLSPPTTGPLSLFNPSDIGMGGGQQFKGKGEASQSNALSGEVSVTVAAVYPHGTMLVKGEKFLTLKDRKSVVEGKGVSVRVDLGGRSIIKTKKKKKQI